MTERRGFAVTRTKFFIAQRSFDGQRRREEVYGWTIGPFGVHRGDTEWWIVTHLPTGFSVLGKRTRRAAIDAAGLAAELPFDWLQPCARTFNKYPSVRFIEEARRKLRDKGIL